MPTATASRNRYANPRVRNLIDRIRGLVAEQRRLERAGASDLAGVVGLEIVRLHEQLAQMVQADLAQV